MNIIKEIVKFILFSLLFSIFMCLGWCRTSPEDEMADTDFFSCVVLGFIMTVILYLAKWAFS